MTRDELHRWMCPHASCGASCVCDGTCPAMQRIDAYAASLTAESLTADLRARLAEVERLSRHAGQYPCCEGVRRLENVEHALLAGWCPIHGLTFPGGPARAQVDKEKP